MSVYLEATRDGQPLLPTIIFSARDLDFSKEFLAHWQTLTMIRIGHTLTAGISLALRMSPEDISRGT